MHFSTTDGKQYDIPDACGYCEMDTAGNHQIDCPCYVNPSFNIIVPYLVGLVEQGYEDLEYYKYRRLKEIREKSFRELGDSWRELAEL